MQWRKASIIFPRIDIWLTFGRFALKGWGARSSLNPNSDQPGKNAPGVPSPLTLNDYPLKDFPMETGTVKFYNDQKGYGFIQPDNGGKDVFVHATALERAGMRGLNEGQKVSFDTAEDRRTGKVAVNNISAA